jgi:hypothetical protein
VTVTSAGGPSNRYRSGTPVTLERISGHRDGDATECPGTRLYAQLPALRDRTAALAAALAVDALTVSTTATTVRAPAVVPLAGALRFADGTPAAARPLTIEYQGGPGDPWQVAGGVLTGADGTWATTVYPGGTCRVRATFAGDGVHPPLAAAPLRIRVEPRVTLAVSHATVRAGRKIAVTGTVGPTWPAKLTLTLERHTARGTVRVRRRRVRIRNGAYRTSLRPARKGRYRLTIEAAGTSVRRKLRIT